MSTSGLSSGDAFLVQGAKNYFSSVYQNPVIAASSPLDKNLSWVPTLSFKIHDHLTVAVEVSETVYPLILKIRRLDVVKIQFPISIYCVCPEEAYIADQASAKSLINDGYGLVTVASDGSAQRRASCIPLVQQIMDEEFLPEIKKLPKKLRARLAESFDRYKHNALSGTADIAEVMEGLILKAGRDAARKGWIAQVDAKAGSPATTLGAMDRSPQFNNTRAAIGGAQAFISLYRNTSHHFPKDKKQAFHKYRDCRHGFLDGLKKISFFRDAMISLKLSGDI